VQPKLNHRDHDIVGPCSYIVNGQSACNDCHTCPSYVIDTVYDRSAQRRCERRQRLADLPHILQVMPWPVYGNMTNEHLFAVYSYLHAIPHAGDGECPGWRLSSAGQRQALRAISQHVTVTNLAARHER
jgi:hypothetical protein